MALMLEETVFYFLLLTFSRASYFRNPHVPLRQIFRTPPDSL
jgi:hypothetical protein